MPQALAAGFHLDAQSREIMHDLRISDQQLSIPVGAGPEYDGWVLVAEDRFDERDVEEARTIQRLLSGLDAHLRILARAERERAGDEDAPTLTSRERVILRLVAEGCTADTMARRLGISPRTVHKHQEHLYRKLGASDRLSAVLAAQRRGLCR
jgi:DNA-binding CsgD family transcriptional regulator